MSTRLAGTFGMAPEQRERDHRPERVTHDVRPLEAERGDEGRQGVGELWRSPALVDVRRLPETGASQAMTVWSRERSGSIHCQMRLSARRTVQHDEWRPCARTPCRRSAARRRRRDPSSIYMSRNTTAAMSGYDMGASGVALALARRSGGQSHRTTPQPVSVAAERRVVTRRGVRHRQGAESVRRAGSGSRAILRSGTMRS